MTKTSIEWAQEVWNPVTGCTKVSQGCKNCYAERIANRFWGDRKFTDVQLHPERLEDPLHWKKPRRVFVNSMSDLFHEDVPDKFIGEVWSRMIEYSQRKHRFLILTKRPERMKEIISRLVVECERKGLRQPSNIWLGVSAEDQKTADERIPVLLETPAAVRFVSCEPLLGPVDIERWLGCADPMHRHTGPCTNYGADRRLLWVITGGESGPNARPMHPDWARSLRDQCQAAGVPFFFKQFGEWAPAVFRMDYPACKPFVFPDGALVMRTGKKAAGRLLDGVEWDEYPEAR